MKLEPLHPHTFLSWMAVPSFPGVYVLGSFARHVTIYSQQIRAINLIDALCRTGKIKQKTTVAVIGGGVAGLTAAAAASVRGAKVIVIEEDSDYFPIQRRAGKRYLHPYIYDWPLIEAGSGAAELPFLSWKAKDAEDVFQDLKEGWESFCKQVKRPQEHKDTRLIDLVPRSNRGPIDLLIAEKQQPKHLRLTAEVVILALGFGRESVRADIQGYWEDAPFDAQSKQPLRWLVSGFGDGGLTDLMRLCIKGFRHETYVEKFAKDSDLATALKELLTEPGEDRKSVRDTFEDLYASLSDKSKISGSDLRKDTEVTFNAPKNHLEHSGSSILNRFIVFQLEKLEKIQWQPGRLPKPLPDPVSNLYQLEFRSDKGELLATVEFDRLVVRHGPNPALNKDDFPRIWEACSDLREKWRTQRQDNDQTRVQMWDRRDYDPNVTHHNLVVNDAFDGGDGLRYLVVESTDERSPTQLAGLVQTSIDLYEQEINIALERQTNPHTPQKLEVVKINDELGNAWGYDRIIRALCKADVAVIDVTGYEPGIMLLLGIRSVVRRGVTLLTTNKRVDSAEWSKLPFNLKELYPLSLFQTTNNINSAEHPIQLLGQTIAKAVGQHHSLPYYQDLPAYEAVRRLGPSPAHYSSIDAMKRILWLCSFDQKYKDLKCEAYVQGHILTEFNRGKTAKDKTRLERITEIVSPQIVTQRLYEAIRRSSLCIVDWTLWSPNVFYELGVRLAASSVGPVCLLAKADGPGVSEAARPTSQIEPSEKILEQQRALQKLFAPIEYDPGDLIQEPFHNARVRYEEMRDYEIEPSQYVAPPTFGSFPYNHTYKLVSEYLPLKSEPGAMATQDYLIFSADALIGVTATSDLDHPVLYVNHNERLLAQVKASAKELLIAAWYYLSNRYSADELKSDSSLLKQYQNLGTRLALMLENSENENERKLYRAIDEILDSLE